MSKKLTTEEFIEKAKMVHGEKYDYSKVDYKDAHSKIVIICEKHGEFLQTPNKHLNGRGCQKCGGSEKLTTEKFIERAKEIHKDNYNYSKVNYKNAHSKITIICKKHGEFLQTPHSHLYGNSCPKCYNDNKKLTTERFIKRAKEVHGDKYDYSKVDCKDNKTKITIICKEHGEFLQNPNSHLSSGCGCPKCYNDSKKLTTEEFIEKAKEVHGDKYDYSKVNYKNACSKITIICKKHGEFLQTPRAHLNMGHGCPKCGGKEKLTTEEFIERAKEVHRDRYDYSKVNYINNCSKITIICKKHGEFLQAPSNHLYGNGCPECSGNRKSTTEEFIERAKEVHRDRYDYSKVDYKDNKTKITIICKKHGEFYQSPSSHLSGNGCPGCNLSKLEELVNFILEKMNLSFNNYSKFEWLGKQNLDVYIKSLNLGIESQGVQHFIPIEHFGGEKDFKLIQKRDKTKLRLSKKNGIDIIYFVTPKMFGFPDIPEKFLKPGGYMGETIVQSEKELYKIIKNRCIEKGVNFVKISEYETIYRNPKFKII